MSKLQLKLVRSKIGRNENQKRVLNALGLKKINDIVVHDDTPSIRGMVNKVDFMLEVTEEQ